MEALFCTVYGVRMLLTMDFSCGIFHITEEMRGKRSASRLFIQSKPVLY
jgi:hypothetical protein